MKVEYLLALAVIGNIAFANATYAKNTCAKKNSCREVKVCFSANMPCQTITINKTGITKLPHTIVY